MIHGSGEQTRDYVFVDDVVDAMRKAATTPNLNRLIINVGSGVETSVNELVKRVMAITGKKPQIVQNKSHDSGPSRMCADLTLAKKLLEFSPKYNLEQGLRETIARDARFQKK